MKTGTATWTYGDGTRERKIHITAGEGKQLTKDGIALYSCVDVDNADGWYEVDAPIEDFMEL